MQNSFFVKISYLYLLSAAFGVTKRLFTDKFVRVLCRYCRVQVVY